MMGTTRKAITTIALLLYLLPISAQKDTESTIYLTIQGKDATYKKTQAIIPIFKFTGQPFEDISNFGAEHKKKANYFTAKLPDMTLFKDTSYGYIYSGAATNKSLPGYFLIVLGNNNRKGDATYWIDRNGNLDLTDDGPPDTFARYQKFKKITIENPENKEAKFTIELSRFPYLEKRRYKSLLNKHYRSHSGQKKFIGANYSFREKRLNVLAGDFVIGKDSFRLGIKDFNCNGYYNDKEVDYIQISPYGKHEFGVDRIEIVKKGNVLFEWNGRQYEITEIEQTGKYVKIKENVGAKLENSLNVNEKLPKFSYCVAQNNPEKRKIRELKGKPLYLFFWNTNTISIQQDTAALNKIYREFGDKIHLLCLNYGNKPIQVRRFRLTNRITYPLGFSTAKINELLFVNEFPRGYLTDEDQRMENTSISPSELYQLLLEKYNKE